MNSNLNLNPLSDEQLRAAAPSIFSGQAHQSMSDRYTVVPTIDIIGGLRQSGFFPVKAVQSIVRTEDKRNFAKHSIRFRSADQTLAAVGDSLLEVALTNSFDGSSAFDLSLGLMRLACLNGLLVADSLIAAIHVRHTGNIIGKIVDGTADLLKNAPVIGETIKQWKTIDLTAPEQRILAEEAHGLRFEEGSNLSLAVSPEKLLQSRRHDDSGSDLWSVFNRVQENTIRGGLRGVSRQPGNVRRVRSREVKGIDQSNSLNKALWSLAAKMAELKTA